MRRFFYHREHREYGGGFTAKNAVKDGRRVRGEAKIRKVAMRLLRAVSRKDAKAQSCFGLKIGRKDRRGAKIRREMQNRKVRGEDLKMN